MNKRYNIVEEMSTRIFENYNVKMVFIYNKSRAMITCCNDGTRPVIFKIERIEIDE